MIKRSFFLLSTAALLFGSANVSIASGSFPNTHTQHTPKLKPASLDLKPDGSFQIASVCFLGGNCGNDGGFNKGDGSYEVDTKQQCKNEGFVNACSSGYCMDHSCPYNNTYGKCLKENCPANSSTTCTGVVDGKNACGVECKKCCSASCPSGYTYSSIPNGYVQDGEPCQHCTQGTKYKVKPNPCNGFSTCQYGPASGATTCLSGSTTKYSGCRPCTETCPSGTSESNPGGCGGSTQNECKTKTCYYPYKSCCDNSCNGYNDQAWQCEDGYSTYTNGCGNTCYKCRICECKNKSYSDSCSSNYPYKNGYSKDSCGYTCGPNCYNAKRYQVEKIWNCHIGTASYLPNGGGCQYCQTMTYQDEKYDGTVSRKDYWESCALFGYSKNPPDMDCTACRQREVQTPEKWPGYSYVNM